MVIHDVKNDRGPKDKFQASLGQVSKIVKNGHQWSVMAKMVKLFENGLNSKYVTSSTGAFR